MGELKALIIVAVVVVFAIAILHIRDGRKIKRFSDGRSKSSGDGGDAINKGDAR